MNFPGISAAAAMMLSGVLFAEEPSNLTAPGAMIPVQAERESPAFDIPKSAANSVLVIRRDDGGQGTGFIVRRTINGQDRFFVYTNQHVIAGTKNLPKAFRQDGTTVRLGRLATAVGYDLAIFALAEAEENFLEIQSDVDKEVSVGETIGTPGNSGGGSTITFKFGRVVAIGPELVEIDSPIRGGNSGGPILHVNGKVVGIVSHLREETKDDERVSNSGERVVRRFGFRVDNVKSWENPDWARFVAQGERIAKVEKVSRDLVQLVESGFSSWNGNEEIGRVMRGFGKNADSARSEKELLGDMSKAYTQLSALTTADLNAAANDSSLYWWWKQTLAQHRKLRKDLDEAFGSLAKEAKQMR